MCLVCCLVTSDGKLLTMSLMKIQFHMIFGYTCMLEGHSFFRNQQVCSAIAGVQKYSRSILSDFKFYALESYLSGEDLYNYLESLRQVIR